MLFLCSTKGMTEQLENSLTSLKAPSVDMFYLHAADVNVEVEEVLSTVQQLYEGAYGSAACDPRRPVVPYSRLVPERPLLHDLPGPTKGGCLS